MKLNVFCMILAVMLVSLILRFVQPLQTGEYILIGSLVAAFSVCFFNTVKKPKKGRKGGSGSYQEHFSLNKRRLINKKPCTMQGFLLSVLTIFLVTPIFVWLKRCK